jgi:hypothetical protein
VCVVSGEAVGDVVRVLAVRADLACQVMHDGQVRSCVSVGSVALTVVMVGTALVCVSCRRGVRCALCDLCSLCCSVVAPLLCESLTVRVCVRFRD